MQGHQKGREVVRFHTWSQRWEGAPLNRGYGQKEGWGFQPSGNYVLTFESYLLFSPTLISVAIEFGLAPIVFTTSIWGNVAMVYLAW